MESNLKRREFIKRSTKVCMGGCLLFSSTVPFTFSGRDGQSIDPAKLCYCGYSCPEDCHFLVASKKNDAELKKQVFEEWELEKRYGLKFDPEQMFCFTCKPVDRPEGPVQKKCTVRICAIERGYQACIECDELVTCEKDLWERYPQFYEGVIDLQKKYKLQQS